MREGWPIIIYNHDTPLCMYDKNVYIEIILTCLSIENQHSWINFDLFDYILYIYIYININLCLNRDFICSFENYLEGIFHAWLEFLGIQESLLYYGANRQAFHVTYHRYNKVLQIHIKKKKTNKLLVTMGHKNKLSWNYS